MPKIYDKIENHLTKDTPTKADEKTLQILSQQLKDKKVVAKLHLRFTLHTKLYLA